MRALLTFKEGNVVLYRQMWGQYSWTRIEETAIKDSC